MIKVGVIRGGVSNEYEASLKSGEHILSYLRGDKMKDDYIPIDILITRDGTWHINGLPVTLEKVVNKVDVIINALHGYYGEDGKVQNELEQWNIPYTGSSSFSSALSFNKVLAKEEFTKLGIKTPKHILYPAYQPDFDGPRMDYANTKAHEVWARLPPPYIVKPLTGGSSMGIHVCKTFLELVRAFEVGVGENVSILVEEMIEGKNEKVGVIYNFRGREVYPLITEGNFSQEEKREMEHLASVVHMGMNLGHYSESNFILHPDKGIYIIGVDTLPKLDIESTILKNLEKVGSSTPELISHIINLARRKN